MDSDILDELDRILAKTPEHSAMVPPLNRRTVAAAAAEIRKLRMVIGSIKQLRDRKQRIDEEGGNTHAE